MKVGTKNLIDPYVTHGCVDIYMYELGFDIFEWIISFSPFKGEINFPVSCNCNSFYIVMK